MKEDASRIIRNADVKHFQQLADGTRVMIWMSGADMGCFYFNNAWLEFRGRTLEQELGNGWAEGVHKEDLERCLQHYTSCFNKRVPFVMSYRLQHHSGEYEWMLDRGAPHYAADGAFLGYFGGCAVLSNDLAVARVVQLREALLHMRDFADSLALAGAESIRRFRAEEQVIDGAPVRTFHQGVRHHAAAQISKLADDMLSYEQIGHGTCL
ncbi:MAG: PAS domain-containing protein [Verrucomicrobiota bacterium]